MSVSVSCTTPSAPSNTITGRYGKTTVPSRIACTATFEKSTLRSQSKKASEAASPRLSRTYCTSLSEKRARASQSTVSLMPQSTVKVASKAFLRKKISKTAVSSCLPALNQL